MKYRARNVDFASEHHKVYTYGSGRIKLSKAQSIMSACSLVGCSSWVLILIFQKRWKSFDQIYAKWDHVCTNSIHKCHCGLARSTPARYPTLIAVSSTFPGRAHRWIRVMPRSYEIIRHIQLFIIQAKVGLIWLSAISKDNLRYLTFISLPTVNSTSCIQHTYSLFYLLWYHRNCSIPQINDL